MKNYKVCVYAISKNEEKFVKRWYNSMKEADEVIVLDTGSTDNTVKLLKSLGATVHEKIIDPWRFDVARNESLKLIPSEYDLCVCTDLDEVFESGWKEKLVNSWNKNVTRVKYTYNWSFDEYNNPATTFLLNKIHKNNYYIWTHPVHEILTCLKEEVEITVEDIVLNHYQDTNKSRKCYLPLLELSVKEDPKDDRNMHYLGREYMYYGMWDEAINTLTKHLSLDTATWKDERCASMRYIARSFVGKKDFSSAFNWYKEAIKEAPYLRESYVELANLYYIEKNYEEALILLLKALEIKDKSNSYINESFAWNSFIYELTGMCYYYLEKYYDAYRYIDMALYLDKDNQRLINDLNYLKEQIKKGQE